MVVQVLATVLVQQYAQEVAVVVAREAVNMTAWAGVKVVVTVLAKVLVVIAIFFN